MSHIQTWLWKNYNVVQLDNDIYVEAIVLFKTWCYRNIQYVDVLSCICTIHCSLSTIYMCKVMEIGYVYFFFYIFFFSIELVKWSERRMVLCKKDIDADTSTYILDGVEKI